MGPSFLLLAFFLGIPRAHAQETASPSPSPAEPALKLSGNRTTTLRYQHYGGLSPAASAFFQSGFTRHETTRLKISGQALGTVKIEGELFQSDVDFDNQYSLKLSTRNYELFLGEFPASFEGSEFALLSRNLQGAKLSGEVPLSDNASPKVDFTLIGSSPRGEPRYEKLFGDDTQGPYQLGGALVVLGSERITIDGTKQVRNADYEINYATGTVTFKRRIVERRSLIEASYESRQTVYARALYGGQVRYKMSEYDTVGISGLDERDRKDAATHAVTGTPASAHTVLGATAKHDGENLRLGGEYAHSFFDPDMFQRGLEHGNACKGEIEVERFGVLVGGDLKRTDPRFRSLGNTALGQDFLGWSAHGSSRLGRVLAVSGEHEEHRNVLNGSPDRVRTTDAKADLRPKDWPRETYRFYQSAETFVANFDRVEKRHTADVSHDLNHLTLGSGYERSEITFRDGTQPDRRWDAGKASLGIKGVPWLAASLNGELRRGEESGSLMTASREYEAALASTNVGFTPHERYYLGAGNNWQRTSGEPARNTLRTEAKAKPVEQLSTQASFSQETLQMTYAGDVHPARADSYAGLVEARPVKSVSLLYQPGVRETALTGIRPAVNADRRDGYTAKWAVGSAASAEASYIAERYRLRDTGDPALRIQTTQDTDTWNGNLRLAPVRAFSSELTYTDRTGRKSQLDTAIPALYDTRDTRQQTVQVGIRPQLESKLGLDSSYRFERYRQHGNLGVASSLPSYGVSPLSQQIQSFSLLNDFTEMHTYEHTVNAGVSYQWLKSVISNASLTYDMKQDRLGRLGGTRTLAASAGLTYRVQKLKVEGTYRLAQSHGGADRTQRALSGSLDFNPVPEVRWTNRIECAVTEIPAAENTDVTSSLEVGF